MRGRESSGRAALVRCVPRLSLARPRRPLDARCQATHDAQMKLSPTARVVRSVLVASIAAFVNPHLSFRRRICTLTPPCVNSCSDSTRAQ